VAAHEALLERAEELPKVTGSQFHAIATDQLMLDRVHDGSFDLAITEMQLLNEAGNHFDLSSQNLT
jgi:hypothetical protein